MHILLCYTGCLSRRKTDHRFTRCGRLGIKINSQRYCYNEMLILFFLYRGVANTVHTYYYGIIVVVVVSATGAGAVYEN